METDRSDLYSGSAFAGRMQHCGETDADVEEFLGVQLESSAGEMTAQDALKKAEDFVNAAAPTSSCLHWTGKRPPRSAVSSFI